MICNIRILHPRVIAWTTVGYTQLHLKKLHPNKYIIARLHMGF